MAEWLYEDGIGEARAALVEDGAIVAAHIELPGTLLLGTVARARLRERQVAVLDDGTEMWLERPPAGVTLGASLTVEVTREAIPERGRPKRARARATDAAPARGATLLERLGDAPVRHLRSHEPDALEAAGWSELLDEATGGEIAFAGGALRMTVAPAMTLFDVDGAGDADDLAVAAAIAIGRAIVRMGIGGSIGIDFPSVAGKAARHAVAAALDVALPAPFERTGLNGFGFLQIVRPRPRASLPERIAADPLAARARAALRRLERDLVRGGPASPVAAPERALIEATPGWTDALLRRTGRPAIWGA